MTEYINRIWNKINRKNKVEKKIETPVQRKRKLTKKERKKQKEKENRKEVLEMKKIDQEIAQYFERHQVVEKKVRKIRFGRRLSSILGSTLLLVACSSPVNHNEELEIVPVQENTRLDNATVSPSGDVSVMDHPLSIGDVTKISEGSYYYTDATMQGTGYSVPSLYVDGDDYNVISAAALVDQTGQIVYVNYEEGFEIFDMMTMASELGIINYQIVLHYGPLENIEISEEVNPYCLGWTSITSMREVKQKKRSI